MDLPPSRHVVATAIGRAIGLRIISPVAAESMLPVLEGRLARALRVAGDAAASEARCPFLCMADLEPRTASARAPLTRFIREARAR